MPVGEKGVFELPAGEVKLSYSERTNPPTENDQMIFYAPEGLEVTVSPADGGDPLEVREPGRAMDRQVAGARRMARDRDRHDPLAGRLPRLIHTRASGPKRAADPPRSQVAPRHQNVAQLSL